MSSFKDEIKQSLNAELDADQLVMDIVVKLKQAIRDSIVSPGVEEIVIYNFEQPLTDDNQVFKVYNACRSHIGINVHITRFQAVVEMKLFLD